MPDDTPDLDKPPLILREPNGSLWVEKPYVDRLEAKVRELEAKVKAEQQQHIEHVAAYQAKLRELEAEKKRWDAYWSQH